MFFNCKLTFNCNYILHTAIHTQTHTNHYFEKFQIDADKLINGFLLNFRVTNARAAHPFTYWQY